MKFRLVSAILACCLLAACNNDKTNNTSQTTDTTKTEETPTEKPARKTTTPSAAIPRTVEPVAPLDGSWELDYVSGPKIAFEGLYPDKKPVMTFDVTNAKVSGNTSCNNFSGKLKTDSNRVNFSEPFVMTKMACPGQGETIFLETLKKVNKYSITDNTTLHFIMGDIAMMRFKRKK